MERAQQILLKRIPEAKFVGSPTIEKFTDVDTVRALRCCSQAKNFFGGEPREESSIACRFGVVEFVDDKDVPIWPFRI